MAASAAAEIPAAFDPVVVRSPISLSERLFDLTPALERAQKLNKPLLIYLGASDCPPCVEYTRFLENHVADMKPVLAHFVVADIRTWLRGPQAVFQMGSRRYSAAEFKALVGERGSVLAYPGWWLLSPDGKALRALPQDERQYGSVERHRKALGL